MRTAGLSIAAAVALALGLGAAASADLNQDGDLVVSFESSMSPTALPRAGTAPVGVRVVSDIGSAAGNLDQLPQLRTIAVGINRQGRLFDRGLPTCRVARIQPATERVARAKCGSAIVGKGRVRLQARLPNQPPFMVSARLLAFNGPRKDGRKLIYAQAYARKPPGAFVLTFRLTRQPGVFGTVMSTTLPRSARRWAYLTHFEMSLRRTYEWRGRERFYVAAGCAAPPGFRSAEFPLAEATYRFGDGRSLSAAAIGRCTVRGG